MKDKTKNKDILFLKKQMKGNTKYFVLSVIFILLGSFFAFLGPKLIGVAVDSIICEEPFDLPQKAVDIISSLGGREYFIQHLYILVIVFITIKLCEAICEFARQRTSALLGENLVFNIRQSIFERLQSATYAYHKSIYTGDIIQRCTTDVTTVQTFVLEMADIIRVIAKIVIAYWFMANISFRLALVSFTTVPLISIVSMYFFGKIEKRFTRADEAESDLQTRTQENLSAPRVVRAFGKQKYERDSFKYYNDRFANMWIKVGDVSAWFWSAGDLSTLLQTVLVLCAGTYFAVNGYITAGDIISFMIYNNMLSWPIRSIGRIVGDMSKSGVSLKRLSEIYYCDIEDYENGIQEYSDGDIKFENVGFSFDGQTLFSDLSFTIPKGKTTAILGASGSGKSTILALLSRFYDVSSGKITIDGVNIKDYNLHTLRQNIGVVMQEPFLFGKTIKENIGITDAVIDMDRVIKSAQIAQVDNAIRSFENGYDTTIGEMGVTLSGGQKQRVAIARTLYAGAKVLCFDDSLSAVDSITDANIRKQLAENISGITTIIISQRVNTLKQADLILVLDDGRIVQQGTHDELMAQGGIYSEIVKIQSDILLQTRQEAENG